MVFDQGSSTTANRFGLGSKKAGGTNQALKFRGGNFCKVFGRPAAGKKGGGHLIDSLVGTLGGEDSRHQELKRVGVIQLTVSVGVGAFELGDDLTSPLGE